MYEDSDKIRVIDFIFQERITEEDGGLTNRIVRLRGKIARNYAWQP